jgi:hypothetical protein
MVRLAPSHCRNPECDDLKTLEAGLWDGTEDSGALKMTTRQSKSHCSSSTKEQTGRGGEEGDDDGDGDDKEKGVWNVCKIYFLSPWVRCCTSSIPNMETSDLFSFWASRVPASDFTFPEKPERSFSGDTDLFGRHSLHMVHILLG